MTQVFSTPIVRKFLGLDRIAFLYDAFISSSRDDRKLLLGSLPLLLAVAIALFPALTSFTPILHTPQMTTVVIGIATILAVVYRINAKLTFQSVATWKRSMSLTHIAVALGCIPVVFIMLFYPEALANLGERIGAAEGQTGSRHKPTLTQLFLTIASISIWAGITEEFIYRGLVVSVARRWKAIPKQLHRDIFAIVLSSALFSIGHLSVWGPWLSVAIFGLGIGLGVAYIAIREEILPLVIYHAAFDVCSLSAAIFLG